MAKDRKGHWKADLCFPCVALYCLPCAIGDLMLRLDLTLCGRGAGRGINSPWNILVGMLIIMLVLYAVTILVVPSDCLELDDYTSETAKANCDDTDLRLIQAMWWLTTIFFWFMMLMVVRMRLWVRERDDIDSVCCPPCCPFVCEDICCGICCTCLTVVQIHRHVDDHKCCREEVLVVQEEQRHRGGGTSSVDATECSEDATNNIGDKAV